MDSDMLPGIIILAIGFFIYFIPTWVALGTRYAGSIFIINLFLGWTFLGWVGALAWAVGSPKNKVEA